ncbi:E3 ubiquitin-protein ligase ATL4-like [Tripterygium wilfordii]|uniref:E3 ubiquitin-protein ligase ATL4-like n=1 Tax=Tripterygium wilfordii TaxID=458696 RepID=UPI0018F8257C|nr:E3 ubiquitin-protein ligase ATL4-like [Tripterygium wilfordii]
MSTAPPPPQLPPPAMLNALATYNGGGHSQSWIQSLKPSILIIILILSITVIVSVSLCFLLRHLNRRCIRHLANTASTSSSSASLSSNRRVSPELSPAFSIIDSLPLFTFSSITRHSAAAASGGGDCAVCLSKFEQHDQLRLLPLCCHVFHAQCIDTWLRSNETIVNQTCPLCRSPIQVSEEDVMKKLQASTATNGGDGGGGASFRLEIGSISRRRGQTVDSIDSARSYSIGSFDYIVEGESEISEGQMHRSRSISNKDENATSPDTPDPEPSLVSEVASGRSWLKEYVDRLSNSLSSRTLSFRSSGRFLTGSSRHSEAAGNMEWDMEANRVGEEISELFRWLSGV